MDKFKILLNFSLEKRIKNKTFLITNIIIVTLLFCLAFVDLYIEDLLPSMFEKSVVYVDDENVRGYFEEALKDNFEIKEYEGEVLNNNREYILNCSDEYIVSIYSQENSLELSMLQNALLQYDQMINYSYLALSDELFTHEIRVQKVEENTNKNSTFGFIVVTAIYFFAMSFASVVANDVVYEKATRMMELILTSTSSTIHLLSKLCAGWLMLLIQFGIILFSGLFILIIRFVYDQFEGLINLLKKLNIISGEYIINLKFIFKLFRDNYQLLGLIILGIVIMFLGILLVQAILMILSSFISNIEEAGTIQSPFYLLFLGVYYLTILLDNPNSMNNGLGKQLSMVPFFSMLFMPCRMFSYEVGITEILLSIVYSIVALATVLIIGSGIYKHGVLDYNGIKLITKK